jgi:hypothetical protein
MVYIKLFAGLPPGLKFDPNLGAMDFRAWLRDAQLAYDYELPQRALQQLVKPSTYWNRT